MKRALLTDFLSSLSQRELYLDAAAVEDVTGILRLDILLFGKIMVPDSHLFDGALLLDTFTPQEFADACGHAPETPRVEIRLRAGTFRESLHDYVFDRGTQRLRPLEYRYLRHAELEHQLAEHLRSSGGPLPTGANVEAALAAEMSGAGVDADIIDNQRAAWNSWEAGADALRMFGTWPRRPFELATVVRQSTLNPSTFASGSGRSAYRDLVDAVTINGDTRSAAADTILRQHFPNDADDTALDLLTLREWYHDCRQIAIGQQHDCLLSTRPAQLRYLVPSVLKDELDASTPVDSADEVGAVRRLVYVLGFLSAVEYRELLSETESVRREWMTLRTRPALTRLVEKAYKILLPGKPKKDKPWYQQERVILPSATTVTGMLVSGPPAAVVAGAITLGLSSAAEKVTDLLTTRGDVRALVRWTLDRGEA